MTHAPGCSPVVWGGEVWHSALCEEPQRRHVYSFAAALRQRVQMRLVDADPVARERDVDVLREYADAVEALLSGVP